MSMELVLMEQRDKAREEVEKLTEERDILRAVVEKIHEPFCSKCGVVNDLHMNLYCRKVQSLTKGIERLKRQLAEAKKGEPK